MPAVSSAVPIRSLRPSRTVTVKVKYGDFQIITRSRSLGAGLVDRRETLRDMSLALIRSVLPTPKGVRLVGVTVSNFEERLGEELPF